MRATLPLVEDHEIIHQGLVLLVRVVRSMEAERTPPPSAIKELLKFFRTFVGEYHHAQEEETFFPALELHGFLRNREPMEAMLQEHSSCKAMFEQMTLHMDELSTVDNAAGAFIAAASQYEELLRDHLFKENNLFYQYANEVLSLDERLDMIQAFGRKEKEALGPGGRSECSKTLATLEEKLFAGLDAPDKSGK